MSYEGHEQHICKNGHQFDADCYYHWADDLPKCPICQADSVWHNSVDDTNCEAYGIILDWSSLQLTVEKTETCNLGHVHITEYPTYRVPTEEELKVLRQFISPLSGEFEPLDLYNEHTEAAYKSELADNNG